MSMGSYIMVFLLFLFYLNLILNHIHQIQNHIFLHAYSHLLAHSMALNLYALYFYYATHIFH